MIAVIGHLVVAAEHREASLVLSRSSVEGARKAPGCLHFSVTADLVEPSWVVVAELWSTRAALDAYRASGSADDAVDPFEYVREFHVQEYDVAPG